MRPLDHKAPQDADRKDNDKDLQGLCFILKHQMKICNVGIAISNIKLQGQPGQESRPSGKGEDRAGMKQQANGMILVARL